MTKNKLYKVENVHNARLAEMGFIKGTIFRVVKKVFGMIQIKLKGSDVVIREETGKEMRINEYEDMRTNEYGDDDWATPQK
jgi:Fe2+ transport system protein FeoA